MKKTLENTPNLKIKQTEVIDIVESSVIDTISGATGSARRRSNNSGGGISSGTEALVNPVNGYYLFNHDLLINALILNDIKPGNPDATAVARRWLINQKPALLVGDDFGKLYDFDKYLNYVRNGRLNGEEPDFSAYISNALGLEPFHSNGEAEAAGGEEAGGLHFFEAVRMSVVLF